MNKINYWSLYFSGGLQGLLQNFAAYQKWCRTTAVRAQYLETLKEMCDIVQDPDCPNNGKHRELDKASIKKSEEAV